MLKRSSTLVLAVALLVLASVPAIAGPNGADRPIKGDGVGLVQFGGEGSPDGLPNAMGCDPGLGPFWQVTTYTTAYGTTSHLGKVRVESAHCPTPVGPADGQMAFVSANGDVLYAEYTGIQTGPAVAVVAEIVAGPAASCALLNGAPCESTGRFAGASGTLTMDVTISAFDPAAPFSPLDWFGTWEGVVSYGRANRTNVMF